MNYKLMADLVLLVHILFVFFVVGGLILIYVGWALKWRWIRNPYFRLVHLLSIGIVVLESWFGIVCPLTIWENALNAKAGESGYQGEFIAHWMEALLYYSAPPKVFTIIYSLFGLLVFISLFWIKPKKIFTKKK